MTFASHHETSITERTPFSKATLSSPHLPASVSMQINSLANVHNVSDEVDTISRYSTALCSRASMSQQSRPHRRNRPRSVAASSARATSMRSCYHQNINYAIITLPWASTFFSPALWRREYEKLTNAVMRNSITTTSNSKGNDHTTDDNRISITHDSHAGLNGLGAVRVACCVRALPDIHKLKLFFKRRLREAKLMPYEQWQQEHHNNSSSNTWQENTRGDVHASAAYSLYNSSTALHRNEMKSGNGARSDYEELAPLPTIWATNASTESDITVYDAFSGCRLMRIHNVKPNAAISTLVHAPFRGLVNKDLEILNVSSPDDLLQVNTKELINTDYVWVGFNDGSIRLFPVNPRSFHENNHTSAATKDNEATHIVYELPKFHNASIIAITRSPCHQDSSSETDLSTCNRYSSIFNYATATTHCTTSTTTLAQKEEEHEHEEENEEINANRAGVSGLHRGKSKSKSKSIATITQKSREHLEIICTASVDSSIVIWDVHKIYRTIEVMRETQQTQKSEANNKNNGTMSNTNNVRAPFSMTSAAKSSALDAHGKSVKWTNAYYNSDMEHEIVTFDYLDRRNNIELTLRSQCTLVKVRPLMRLKGGVSALKTLHWVSTLITTSQDWNKDNKIAPENDVVHAEVNDINSYSVNSVKNDAKAQNANQPRERKQREVQELTRFMRREEHRKRVNLSMEQMREVEVEMNRLMPQCVAEPVQSLRVNLLIASDNIGTIHLWNLDDELTVKTNLETTSGSAYEKYRNSLTRERSKQQEELEQPEEEEQQLFSQATKIGSSSTEISANNTTARNSCVTFAPTAKTTKTAASSSSTSKAAKTLQFSSMARRSISPAVQLNARKESTKTALKQKNQASGVNGITTVGNYSGTAMNAPNEQEKNSVQTSTTISETMHPSVMSDADNAPKKVMNTIEANKHDENDNSLSRASHSNSPYRSTSSIPHHSQANEINVKYTSLTLTPSSKSPERGVKSKRRSTSMQAKPKTRSKPPESSPATLSPQRNNTEINLYNQTNMSGKINHEDYSDNHNNLYKTDEIKSVQFVSAARMGKLQRLALQYQYDRKNQHNNNNSKDNISGINSNNTNAVSLASMQLSSSGAEMVSPFKDVKDFSASKLHAGQRSPSRVNTTRSNRRSLSMLQTSREVSVKQGVEFNISEELATPTSKLIDASTTPYGEVQDKLHSKNYSAEANLTKSSKKTAGLLKPSNAKQLPTGTKSVSMSRAVNRQKSVAMKRGVSLAAATPSKSAINSNVNYDKHNQRATSMSVLSTMQTKQTNSYAISPSHLPESPSSFLLSSHGQANNAVTHEPQSFAKRNDRKAPTSKLSASSSLHPRATSTTPAKSKLSRTGNIATTPTTTTTTTTNATNREHKLTRNGKMSKMNAMPAYNDHVDVKAANTKPENTVREESAQTRERMNELLSRTASCRLNFTGGVAINGMAIHLPAVITTTMRRVAPTNETSDSLFQIPSPEQIEQRTLQNSFFVLDDDKALYLAFQQLQMYVAVEGTVLSLRCLPHWHGADCDDRNLFAERHNKSRKTEKCDNNNIYYEKSNNPRKDETHEEETVIDGKMQMPSFAITLSTQSVELHSQPVANLLLDKRRRELWICRNDGYVSIFAADQKRIVSRLPHPTCTAALGAEDELEWRRNQELLSMQLNNINISNNNYADSKDISNLASNKRVHLRLELHRECENLPPSRFTQFISYGSRTESVMTLMLRRTLQSELWSAMSNMHVTFQDVNQSNIDTGATADQSQHQEHKKECDENSNTEEMCSLLSQTRPYVETNVNENIYTMNKNYNNDYVNADDVQSNKSNALVTNERKIHEVHLLDGRSDLNIHSRYLEIHSHHKLVLLSECKERANMVHRAQQGHYEMLCSNIGKNTRKLINKSEMLELWSTLRWYYDTWREHANRFHRTHISRECKLTRLEKCEHVAEYFMNILRTTLTRSCFASWQKYVMCKRMSSFHDITQRLLISYSSIHLESMPDRSDVSYLRFVMSRTRYLVEYYSCFNAFKQWKEFALAQCKLRKNARHEIMHGTEYYHSNKLSGLMYNAENAVNNLRFTIPKQNKYSSMLSQKISKKALKSILHNAKHDVDLTSSFDSTTSAHSILPLSEHSLPPIINTFLDVVVDIFNARAAIIHFSDHCHSQKNVINESSLSIIEIAEANVEDADNVLEKKVAVLQYGLLPLLQGLLVTAEDVLPNLHDPAVASEVITMFMSIHLCLDYILADAEELLTDIEEYELSNEENDDDNDDEVNVVEDDRNKLVNDKVEKEQNASATKNSNNINNNNIAYRMSMCRNRESVLNINKMFAQKQQRIADTYEMYRVKPSTLCRQLMQLLAAMVMDDEECVEAMEDVTMNLESFESFMAALTGDESSTQY